MKVLLALVSHLFVWTVWFLNVSFIDAVSIMEKVALLDFYNSTNGEFWYPYKWNISQLDNNPCNLTFIYCNSNNSNIIGIETPEDNNLNGTI